jgi:hypothetical protein
MPKNRAVYIATLVIAASALLYLGDLLTTYVRPMLPWTTGVGILLLLVGIFYEAQQRRAAGEDRTL